MILTDSPFTDNTNISAHAVCGHKAHCRHLLDEENVPAQEIQRLLGHADPRTTQAYIDKRRNLAGRGGAGIPRIMSALLSTLGA